MKNQKKKLLTVSLLASSSAVLISLINKSISATAVFKNLLSPDKGSFYKWKFGNIYYTKSGHGKPLLLIHDLNACSSSYEWHRMIHTLEKYHTVYAIDLLGCGRSDKPDLTYTNFLYVQMINDFVQNVIHDKTDVIASGLSTSFAIMSCLNNESLFDKLMLISPEDLAVLNQTPTRHSKAAKFMLELPVFGTMLYHILVCRQNVELLFTEKYFFNPFHTDPKLIDVYYESAHRQNGNGRYLQASIAGRYVYCNVSHALKEINNSIFIIAGDHITRIQESIALYQSLNSSIEAEIIEKTNLLPQLECPDKVLEIIDIFFNEK